MPIKFFVSAFSIQDGYAKAAGVNLLVAGYSNVTNGMAGAAIFGANATILAHSFTPAAAQNIFTAQVPRITARTPQAVCDSNQEVNLFVNLWWNFILIASISDCTSNWVVARNLVRT